VSSNVEAHLLLMGFKQVDSIAQQVSVHLTDVHNRSSVNIGFQMSECEGVKALQIRKVKTGSRKLYFASVVNPAGRPDYRFKLLAQHAISEKDQECLGPEVWSYARACKLTDNAHPFVKSSSSNAGMQAVLNRLIPTSGAISIS
jgi:hypothetical protein